MTDYLTYLQAAGTLIDIAQQIHTTIRRATRNRPSPAAIADGHHPCDDQPAGGRSSAMTTEQPEQHTWDYAPIPPPPPLLGQTRDRANQFESPRNQPQRDAWAADRWTINRWTCQEIATALGLASKSAGHAAVQRGLHVIKEQTALDTARARAAHRARLEYAVEVATEVMEKDHVTISYGQIMKGGDGKPLIDYGPKLAAAAKIKELSESLRRLDGLDAATKVEHSGGVTYEIVGISPEELA